MWDLLDFLVCWMLLDPEARRLIHTELEGWNRLRVWRFDYQDPRVIGA